MGARFQKKILTDHQQQDFNSNTPLSYFTFSLHSPPPPYPPFSTFSLSFHHHHYRHHKEHPSLAEALWRFVAAAALRAHPLWIEPMMPLTSPSPPPSSSSSISTAIGASSELMLCAARLSSLVLPPSTRRDGPARGHLAVFPSAADVIQEASKKTPSIVPQGTCAVLLLSGSLTLGTTSPSEPSTTLYAKSVLKLPPLHAGGSAAAGALAAAAGLGKELASQLVPLEGLPSLLASPGTTLLCLEPTTIDEASMQQQQQQQRMTVSAGSGGRASASASSPASTTSTTTLLPPASPPSSSSTSSGLSEEEKEGDAAVANSSVVQFAAAPSASSSTTASPATEEETTQAALQAPASPAVRPPSSDAAPPAAAGGSGGFVSGQWTAHEDEASKRTYYVNSTTGETSWTAPAALQEGSDL